MNLLGLDATLEPVRTLQCLNIQWNRKYYEAGDFALQLRAGDWDSAIAYVFTPDRPETGMVQKVETEHNVKGDFVNVSGFFLEGLLGWGIIYPVYSWNGNLPAMCLDLADRILRPDHPRLTLDTLPSLGSNVSVRYENGEGLGETTFAALKAQELSQRIRYDYASGRLIYSVWQGADRTQEQSANAYAVFSQDFGTVDTLTLTQDESAFRNYAIVVYDGGNLELDLRVGTEPRRMMYVDTGLSIGEGQAENDFLSQVRAEGQKQLSEYARIVNVDADVVQSNFRYLRDYDLGDRCDVRDDRLKLAFEARIIEIREVWKNNEHTVSLQFGDKIPTGYPHGRA